MSPSRQSTAHVRAIDALAAETDRPIEEVAEIYMGELGRLRSGARIEDYLVLLTTRHVREALRRPDRRRFLKPLEVAHHAPAPSKGHTGGSQSAREGNGAI